MATAGKVIEVTVISIIQIGLSVHGTSCPYLPLQSGSLRWELSSHFFYGL